MEMKTMVMNATTPNCGKAGDRQPVSPRRFLCHPQNEGRKR